MPGRLVVRRIPYLVPRQAHRPGEPVRRVAHHQFFITTPREVADIILSNWALDATRLLAR